MKIYHFMTGPIQVNTYLVFDENGTGYIVDPGDYVRGISDIITEENIDLQYIVLTHGHADHIGGVAKFRELYPDLKVVAYTGEREMLHTPDYNSSLELYGREIACDADIWVEDGDTMTIGTMELKFIFTPGHSPGGMCILTEGYLFSGDTLFRASIGRTDFWGGDFQTLINSIRNRLFILPDDTVVLPGHMGQTTIRFEKECNPFVR